VVLYGQPNAVLCGARSFYVPDDYTRQSLIDEEHLKLLSLGYMISAAITGLFALFGLMYIFMGAMMIGFVTHSSEIAANNAKMPPAFIGWFLGSMGLAFFVFGFALAAAKLYAAICVKNRKSRTFCLVVAGFTCLAIPYGTALGVFTFIVLGRDSVVRLFPSSPPPSSIA
jgi:hypothetical protein